MRQALKLAQNANYSMGEAKAYRILGSMAAQNHPDSAGIYYREALAIYTRQELWEEEAEVVSLMAGLEIKRTNPHKALQLLLTKLAEYEKTGKEEGIGQLCITLGDTYHHLYNREGGREYELRHQEELLAKARQYYARALAISGKYNNPEKAAEAAHALANLHLENGETDLAAGYYQQVVAAYQSQKNLPGMAYTYTNLSRLKFLQGNEKEGLELTKKAINLYLQTGDTFGHSAALNNLGAYYTEKGDQQTALGYYLQALELAKKSGRLDMHQDVAGNLYWAYKDLNQPAKALEFYELYSTLDDSIFNLSRAQQIAELQEKYETEKKQRQIELLNKDKELQQANISRRTWERNATIAGLFFTLLLAYFIIRNIRQRQKATALLAAKNEELNRNRIQELLREQELASVHGILQGQEAERKRIAQDLHDRLGSLLATVKLHFQIAKTEEQRQTANALMDDACQEVRQIAHNMVSGVLMKFGLVAALKDLAQAINATGKVHIQTMAHGLNQRLPGNSEIEIYRIVQELVSNALKHAGAKEITVQLNKRGNLLNLMVEDDGKGFTPAKAKNQGGMGLQGVQSRVNQLHGELSIDSSPGRGATILIEIPLDLTDPLSPETTPQKQENHDPIAAG